MLKFLETVEFLETVVWEARDGGGELPSSSPPPPPQCDAPSATTDEGHEGEPSASAASAAGGSMLSAAATAAARPHASLPSGRPAEWWSIERALSALSLAEPGKRSRDAEEGARRESE